jgi:dCTP diphosphatase
MHRLFIDRDTWSRALDQALRDASIRFEAHRSLRPECRAAATRPSATMGARGASMPDSIDDLTQALRHFADERDWARFHAPKNLASALVVEAAELLEPFQWLSEADSRTLPPEKLQAVADEMADVLLYLVQLSSALEVDLLAAARAKLARNAQKYPVERAHGNARKYDEL